MFDLNNKGWGIITFVLLISLLMCSILIVSLMVNDIGGIPLSVRKDDTLYLIDYIEK